MAKRKSDDLSDSELINSLNEFEDQNLLSAYEEFEKSHPVGMILTSGSKFKFAKRCMSKFRGGSTFEHWYTANLTDNWNNAS
jgi:hypothetical protein